MRFRLAAALVLALTLGPRAAPATVARWLEIDELTLASELVVRARVVDQHPASVPGDGKPRTDTVLEVLGTYKGNAPASVTVRQIAGATGAGSVRVPGDATFDPGEEVVVFLLSSKASPGVYFLTALAQSKFTLVRGPGGVLLRRDLSDLGIWTPGSVVEVVDVPVALPLFEAAVREAASGDRR